MDNLASKDHAVELSNDQNIEEFRDNTDKFQKIKVAIHSTNVWPTSRISENYVTIYLVLPNSRDTI